ncbi:MAG: DUF6321 domain-containing protein [Caldimonas sp.]
MSAAKKPVGPASRPPRATAAAPAKTVGRKVTRDPRGGLTAAGRAEFARSQGAHLRPGVKKAENDMTPEDMKRKGSWAVRFYGRSGDLPALLDDKGEPTRFALTAAAWGESVPKTEAAARRIAEKGRKLLARYHRLKDEG